MSVVNSNGIRAIVFDLDGTLYVSDGLALAIQAAAAGYIAGLQGVSHDQARGLMADTRRRMQQEAGVAQTLSAVCCALGGTVQGLHNVFISELRPEDYLRRDDAVVRLLERLGQRFDLYLYTNNNRTLTGRIISALGLDGLFRDVFTIDDCWRSKPDQQRFEGVLQVIGARPEEILFVGDRYEVDLRLPEQNGCPIYLTRNIAQLMRLERLIGE